MNINVGFQAFTTATMKSMVFWLNLPSASVGFLLGLLFDPEDGGDVLLKRQALFETHGVETQNTVLLKVKMDSNVTDETRTESR
jgi:hypothetical protein